MYIVKKIRSSSAGLSLLEASLLLGTLALVATVAIPVIGEATGGKLCNAQPDSSIDDGQENFDYTERYYYKRVSLATYRCCKYNGSDPQCLSGDYSEGQAWPNQEGNGQTASYPPVRPPGSAEPL